MFVGGVDFRNEGLENGPDYEVDSSLGRENSVETIPSEAIRSAPTCSRPDMHTAHKWTNSEPSRSDMMSFATRWDPTEELM